MFGATLYTLYTIHKSDELHEREHDMQTEKKWRQAPDRLTSWGISDEGEAIDPAQVETCERWLREFATPQKAVNQRAYSYSLKHQVERWATTDGNFCPDRCRQRSRTGPIVNPPCRLVVPCRSLVVTTSRPCRSSLSLKRELQDDKGIATRATR